MTLGLHIYDNRVTNDKPQPCVPLMPQTRVGLVFIVGPRFAALRHARDLRADLRARH